MDTLCVADHVIKQIQIDFPTLRYLYRKSDNAACYAGNSVAEILYTICKQQNIQILRYDYNECQRGKDQTDRDSAVAKRFLSAFIHSGNNCLSADDIKKGILHQGGLKNASVSVAEIDKSACLMSHSKIVNIQSFHSVLYHKLGMVFWQYFECGAGKFYAYQDLKFVSGLKVVDESFPVKPQDLIKFYHLKKDLIELFVKPFSVPRLAAQAHSKRRLKLTSTS